MIQIWAHRGASAYAPENTLPAFQKAIELESDGVELDVHLSRDGEVMVFHDDTVDRCTNGTGKVKRKSCAELKQLDCSYTFPAFHGVTMPTLREVYELLAPTGLTVNVELKPSAPWDIGLERKCVALAEEFGLTQRVIYSSFHFSRLRRLRLIDQNIPSALLYEKWKSLLIRPLGHRGRAAVHPEFADMFRREAVERLHRAGQKVNVWTVNEPEDVRRLAALDVDAIITNKPDLVRQVLSDLGLAHAPSGGAAAPSEHSASTQRTTP